MTKDRDAQRQMAKLIARSSLGSPHARSLQRTVPGRTGRLLARDSVQAAARTASRRQK